VKLSGVGTRANVPSAWLSPRPVRRRSRRSRVRSLRDVETVFGRHAATRMSPQRFSVPCQMARPSFILVRAPIRWSQWTEMQPHENGSE
jgi:hypothetical protein